MASAFLVEEFTQTNVFVWIFTNHKRVCLDMHCFIHLIIGCAIRYPKTGDLRYKGEQRNLKKMNVCRLCLLNDVCFLVL